MKRVAKKPKYKVGQVIAIRTFWKESHGERESRPVGRISDVRPPDAHFRAYHYKVAGWLPVQFERDLRPLTKRERG